MLDRLGVVVVVLAFLATVLPLQRSAWAQPDSGARPLSLPTGSVLRCRVQEVGASLETPAVATRLLFEIGADPRASTRVVDVAFDSSGTPLTLVAVSTDHDPDGASLLEAVAARFTKEGTVAGLHTRQRGAALAESTATTVAGSTRTPLTEREGADARRLASWFWARRCGRQNGVKIR